MHKYLFVRKPNAQGNEIVSLGLPDHARREPREYCDLAQRLLGEDAVPLATSFGDDLSFMMTASRLACAMHLPYRGSAGTVKELNYHPPKRCRSSGDEANV